MTPAARRTVRVASLAVALVGVGLFWLAGESRRARPEPAAPAPVPCATASASAAPAASATFTAKRIPRLDVHTHVDPDVAAPARDFLRERGIGRAVNLSGGKVGAGLEESLAGAREAGGYFVVFANVDFEGIGTPGWAAREVAALEAAHKAGAKGVKIPKTLGLRVRFPDGRRVAVDDPVLDPVFAAMARLHMPLAIHTGDPKAFFDPPTPTNERIDELGSHPTWSFSDRGLYPTWEALVDEFERRVARSAKTTVIGVHFGNAPEDPERVGRMLDRHPNLWIDTAARVPEIGRKPELARKVIVEHADRVLFGTDTQLGRGFLVLGAGESRGHVRADVDRFFGATYRFFETNDRGFAHPTPIQGRWTIDGIGLPDEVLEAVYHRNAERLLGLPPTELP